MARTSYLDKFPELRDFVALKYIEGYSNQAIADAVNNEWEALNVHKDTIITWRKDDEVDAKVHRLNRERVARILRRTDTELERRLEKMAQNMDTDELIKLRKEFRPERDAHTDEKVDRAGLIQELFGAAQEDPELAQKIADASKGADASPPE